MKQIKAVIIADNVPWYHGDVVDYVYGAKRVSILQGMCELHPVRITSENLEEELAALKEVEVIISCWGMLSLTPSQLDRMPNLKAIFYAGGSVDGFAVPFFERGIIVCSGVAANAIPVAEFCLAQILLSCKGAYRNSVLCNQGAWVQSAMPVGRGIYGETVALLGIGMISRCLLRLLKPFNLRVIAACNYLSPEQAREIGLDAQVALATAFREGYIVSNHFADKPSNRGLLCYEHFASMRQGATFINTGRGTQVDEAGMIAALKARPDLTALLDVQHPEPPDAGSELYALPNVHMTSHIAGSLNDEVRRMADCMIEDFKRWRRGQMLEFQVDPSIRFNLCRA